MIILMVKTPKPLSYRLLRHSLKASCLSFKTTRELKRLGHYVGQERARAALQFGLSVQHAGYHLYAMSTPGFGKLDFIKSIVSSYAKKRPTPNDWCYLYNFKFPEKPLAVSLPPGVGRALQQSMQSLAEGGRDNLSLINPLKKKYKKYRVITQYLTALKKDMSKQANQCVRLEDRTYLSLHPIHVMVDNSEQQGAPVIFEPSPSHASLIGRMENVVSPSNQAEQVTFIKPGALYLANGGYLILEMRKLKKQLAVWERLKNILYAQAIQIEPSDCVTETAKFMSLTPAPIPLEV